MFNILTNLENRNLYAIQLGKHSILTEDNAYCFAVLIHDVIFIQWNWGGLCSIYILRISSGVNYATRQITILLKETTFVFIATSGLMLFIGRDIQYCYSIY